MSGAIVLLAVVFAVAIPLGLWIAIEGETSDPTVVDRTEAERIARERGGRDDSRSISSDRANADRSDTGDHSDTDDGPGEADWGSKSTDRWDTRADDSDRHGPRP